MNFIFDKEAKTLFADGLVLVQGEDRETVFKIPLEIDPDDEYNCFFEFKLPGGKTYVDSLSRKADFYEYSVTKVLTQNYGRIDFQLVMYNRASNSVYKTIPVIKGVTVRKSINASLDTQIDVNEAQKSYLFDLINTKLDSDVHLSAVDELEQAISELNVAVQEDYAELESKINSEKSAILQQISSTNSTVSLVSEKATANALAIDGIEQSIEECEQQIQTMGNNTVKTVSQTFTESQKAYARGNIGAITALDVYPVGSVYISFSSVSPATLFGGVWASVGDKFLVGVGDNFAEGAEGGESTHKLTTAELPSHRHDGIYDEVINPQYKISGKPNTTVGYGITLQSRTGNSYSPIVTALSGGSGSHNNLPPYCSVYMWKRVE